LSSLDVGIFNRVFNCENAHELWKTIKEQNEGSKEVANERYGCLLEEFNSFKQLANENDDSMYSRLNVLVNEINALGVKNITDFNINRKILQSLGKPDFDLVKAIIYEKKLEELKPSHILSKIMVHELQIMPMSKKVPQEKLQEPSSPTTSHTISSQQEKVMSRMATHGRSSEDDGDDGDEPQAISSSGREPSSCSSSDESRKNFTTRFMQGPSSSPHMCLMAQVMESNVSDGESDTTSLDELVELVHEQKGRLKKQAKKLKNSMLSMILVKPLLQMMNICCVNSNCFARSVMS
jgi:hypothetical protein